MRKFLSFLLAALLFVGSSATSVTLAATPTDQLAAAKNAYLDYTTEQLQVAAQRIVKELQNSVKTTTFAHDFQLDGHFQTECTEADESGCGTDGLQKYTAGLTTKMAAGWNTPELMQLPSDTPAATALKAAKLQLATTLDLRVSEAATGERLKVTADVQILLENGVLYLGLNKLETTDLDKKIDWMLESGFLQAWQAKKWLKVDLLTKFADELEGQTVADLLDSATTDWLTEDGLNTLIQDYVDQVWRANTIFTVIAVNDQTGTLQFGAEDLSRLLNAHFTFIEKNYQKLKPFLPFYWDYQMGETARERAAFFRQLRRDTWEEVKIFTPMQLAVAFAGGQVANLRFVKTWQEDESRGYDYSDDGDSKARTAKRNLHVDVRYYLNGSLDPLAAALDAYFATRALDEAAPSQFNLKVFPAVAGEQAFKLTGTALKYSHNYDYDQKKDLPVALIDKIEISLDGKADVATGLPTELNWKARVQDLTDGNNLPLVLVSGYLQKDGAKMNWKNTVESVPADKLRIAVAATTTAQTGELQLSVATNFDSDPWDFDLGFAGEVSQDTPVWQFSKFATQTAGAAEMDAAVREVSEKSVGTLTLGTPVTGTLTAGKTDVWTFTGTAGQVVNLQISTTDKELDTRLTLENAAFEWLTSDDDSALAQLRDGGLDPAIKGFELPASGTYRVLVNTFSDSVGAYTLTSTLQ